MIIGGGPTGVEMAGAIAEVARQTLARDFRRIDPRTARIVLIEAGPRLLPTCSEKHSSSARDTLAAMSDLPPKADIVQPGANVRFVPKAAVSRCSKNPQPNDKS